MSRLSVVRRFVILGAAAFMLTTGVAGAGTYNGSVNGFDLSHAGGVLDNGTVSTCGGPAKAFPGVVFQSDQFHYDLYSEANSSTAARCVSIQLEVPTGTPGHGAFVVAYLDSVDASDLSKNYLGDSGVAIAPGETRSFGVDLPPGHSVVVDIDEYFPGEGVGSYRLTINGLLPTATTVRSFRVQRRSNVSGSSSAGVAVKTSPAALR